MIAKFGGRILGIEWNPTIDELSIAPANLSTFDRHLLTLHNVLCIINSIYDPLGLIAPLTIRLHIGFRNLFAAQASLSWDDLLPAGPDQDCWLSLIKLHIDSNTIIFKRCIKPVNAVRPYQLVSFFDGSNEAFATVI